MKIFPLLPCPGSYGPKLKIHVGNWAEALSVISTLWSQASYFQQFNKSAWITKWIGVTTRRSLYGQKRFKTLYTAWSIERRSELAMRSIYLGSRNTYFWGENPTLCCTVFIRRVSSERFAELVWIGLWGIWVEQYALYTWCLPGPTRKESNIPKCVLIEYIYSSFF